LRNRRAYLAWVTICLVWGTTYLAISVAIESLPPLQMAGIRWIVAGALILAFFGMRGVPLAGPSAFPSLALRGVLLIGFGNGAVVWAQQTVPSGLVSVFVAVAPFWMVGIDALAGDHRSPKPKQWAGLLLGFAGMVLLVSPEAGADVTGRAFLNGLIATQLACAGWAIGSIYARRNRTREAGSAVAMAAYEMVFGGVVLLVAGLLLGERLAGPILWRSLAAVAYLVVFGSIIAFSSYRYAIQHLPVATVSLYVYVNTVIAVILGTLVLSEPFSWRMGIGAAVVLSGTALVKESDG
jgi:drug/metabolite transporter (DMT)-like permease